MRAPRSAFLSWLHQHYRGALFFLVVAAAALFRLYRLTTLPPGLSPEEGAAGLEALGLSLSGLFNAPSQLTGALSSLFGFLAVKVIGSTPLALRVVPALAGIAAVVLCYQWAKAWFGRRVAVLTAFLLAVTPWAVTLSRTGVSASWIPFWQMMTLWLLTVALHRRSALWSALAGLSLGLGVYVDGAWWFVLLAVCLASLPAVFTRNRLGLSTKQLAPAAVAFTAALLPIIVALALKAETFRQLLSELPPAARMMDGVARAAAMFNLHGDDNYVFNLGGLPLLNFFVGVMFIIGLLILMGQLRRSKYLALFLLLVLGLVPAALSGRPDAARAAGALIPALTAAAMGISYMLERWYQTFPINAAARSAGLAAMVFVLAMTGYQGYNQYFIAWAQTPATYEAHAEGAVAMAKYLRESVYESKQYVLLEPDQRPTLDFLANRAEYQIIKVEEIDGVSPDELSQFVISYSLKDEALRKLKARYPKARLTPYLSDFNNAELFSVFEVRK